MADEENNPLQCSFSQILNSDVLFSFDDEDGEDSFMMTGENTNADRNTAMQFNFTDNFTGQSIEEVFLKRNTDDDDFSSYTTFLEMSF